MSYAPIAEILEYDLVQASNSSMILLTRHAFTRAELQSLLRKLSSYLRWGRIK
jgi:hypothetical protein